jgi:hypothetical protein
LQTAFTAETGRLQAVLDAHMAAITLILGDTQTRVDDIIGRLPPAGAAAAAPPPAAAPPAPSTAVPRPPPATAPPDWADPRGRAVDRPAASDTTFIDPKYSQGDDTVPKPTSPAPLTSPRGTRARPPIADITVDPSATADDIADGVLGKFK